MSSPPFLHAELALADIRLPRLGREFLFRAGLVALFVLLTYCFPWQWLRFVTSAAVLRISASLGMAAARVSFDTIRIQGQLFRVVIACTFVDVVMGSLPLLWDVRKSLSRNGARLLAVAVIFFALNLVRLEIAQVLYFRGVSWTFADQVLGGCAYFAVWLFLWRQRTWRILREV